MNAIDGFEVLLVCLGTLPIAAVMARCTLTALFRCLSENSSEYRPLAADTER